jgi:DNA-binding MarR family transcriptional regulator
VTSQGATVDVAEEIEQAMTALLRGPRMRRLHELLNRRAGLDLDRPSYVALASLDDQGPMRISDLAEACGVETSTMSRLADRLAARRLVERAVASGDQRAVMLSLSAEGKRLRRKLRTVGRESLKRLLDTWSPAEQREFARLLGRFVGSLEAAFEDAGS